MKQESTIKCPNCGEFIDVEEVLSHKLREELQTEFNRKLDRNKKEYESRFLEIEKQKLALEEDKKHYSEKIESEVTAKLRAERKNIEQKLRNSIKEENEDELKALREELKQKSSEAKDLNKLKIEMVRLQREKEEMHEKIVLETEEKFDRMIKLEREKIRNSEAEAQLMKIKEKENVIEGLKKQLSEAHRKAEQGSMQLQGEVQELAIEDFLRQKYPFDDINEIKKGERGGDTVQTVMFNGQICGTIYYESKRTKSFSKTWLPKFKEDMIAKGADVGILVTESMPDELKSAGLINGIWVCSFPELATISYVIRESVVNLHNAIESGKNTEGKMGMLYQYLTSNEFKMQIEEIIGGFVELKGQIDTEKRAMEKQWKVREKQLERVLVNTTRFYGSIKGIAGKAIPDVKLLELPGESDD